MNFFYKKRKKLLTAILCLSILIGSIVTVNAQWQQAPACDAPNSASGSFSPGLSFLSGSVDNPGNGIDGNLSSYTTFTAGFGFGFGASWTYTINLNGSYSGDIYINTAVGSSILTSSVLGSITIAGYNNGTQVWSSSLGSSFASWGINVGNAYTGTMPEPGTQAPYNQIVVTYSQPATVSITGPVFYIYEIRRVPYQPNVSIAQSNNNACTGTTTLTASPTNVISNNLTYAWYQGSSASGSVISTSPTLTGAQAGNTYTAAITIDNGCSFAPTVRTGTQTFSVPSVPAASVSISQGCNGTSGALTAKATGVAASSYTWTAGNGGTIISGANEQTVNIGSNGTYTVVVNSSSGNCSVPGQSFTVSNYSVKTCNPNSLPISLSGNFTGTVKNGAVVLNWKTATEINNRNFEIWKSLDGKSYSLLASVPGNAADGNSTSPLPYTYTDPDPANGTNYYQLKQIDLNGTSTIVSTIEVNVADAESGIRVFPNPATIKLSIQGAKMNSSYRIINTGGRTLVPSTTLSGNEISIGNLAPGIYILQIISKNNIHSVKFIKK